MTKQQILQLEITQLSKSDNWQDVKNEWKLDSIFFEESYTSCLCTHYPIVQCCILKNSTTNKEVIVGNCCVKRFLDLKSNTIFECVKRLKKDDTKSLNKETLEFAADKRWINNWEYEFYSDTIRKRKLSTKQLTKRQQINNKILKKI